MADFLSEHAEYDSFAREWHSDTIQGRDVTLEEARERDLISERDTRRLWQLLGLVDDGVFIRLPQWLAAAKAGDSEDDVPTMFVGRIARETDEAVLFEDSAPARRLMAIAHKIHSLEHGRENTAIGSDRRERLDDHLRGERRRFEGWDDEPYFSDEWLPKSQLLTAVRRER